MNLSSNNIKFASYGEVNNVTEKLFKLLHSKYQNDLEASIKRSDFIFDLLQVMFHNYHKVNFKRGSSYIDFPNWIKKNKQHKIQKMKMTNVFNTQQLLH